MASDIRDEAALRAMAALIAADDYKNEGVIALLAFSFADAFMMERKRQAEKRESELRAKLNHD